MMRRIKQSLMTKKTAAVFFVILLLCISLFYTFPPSHFPTNTIVTIHSGDSLTEVGKMLKNAGLIRSSVFFTTTMILFNHEHGVILGDYIFPRPISVFSIAQRISSGDFGFPVKRITIPEGTTVRGITELVPKDFFHFDAKAFMASTTAKEGYLFPDTYFFPTNATAETIMQTLSDTFDKKITPLRGDILISKHTLKDVITMASILEEEALTSEDRKIVAGILWKRMKIGMRLQVDAPLDYERGKNTFELTTADLKKDSPYNTYTRTGLPPTPISNPGLVAIDAAIHPTESNYLYYLSDKKGTMHYAATFEQHVANKRKYLQ